MQNDGVNEVDVLGMKYYLINCNSAKEKGKKVALAELKKWLKNIDWKQMDMPDSPIEGLKQQFLYIDKMIILKTFADFAVKCEKKGEKVCIKEAKKQIKKAKANFRKKYPYCKVPQFRCPKNTCKALIIDIIKKKFKDLKSKIRINKTKKKISKR